LTFWVDAQLPPKLADFLKNEFEVEAYALRDFGLRDAMDLEIFQKAKLQKDIVIIAKDSDFLDLLFQFGEPPKILFCSLGNINNETLFEIFKSKFLSIQKLLPYESLIELKK
jgi:predicted nuclease of predicted toxin-antitoxin system